MTILLLIIGIPLGLVIVYLAFRFGSAAFFKSKREFEEWYTHKRIIADRRKGD